MAQPKDPVFNISRDELLARQLQSMKWSLTHAYENVAFYRQSFDGAGVHPDDLASLADLVKFPFTVKQNLRDNYPYGMFAVPREKVSRLHASSGTTGKPTVVGYTARDIDNWADLVARSIRAAGGKAGDIVHVAYGYGLFTGGLGAHYGAERCGCTVVPLSGGATEKQIQLIKDLKPDIIMVTPSYMLTLADGFAKQGLDPAETSLRIGIHGAEPWTDQMRHEIETLFNIDAVDIYGLSEVMGPGVGQEFLETKDGPTIWEDHFYPEIINPETGDVVDDGEDGELVFTSLSKEALPIIRYRTSDLTRLLPGNVSAMRRIARIKGRSDDMMIIRGVNVFPTQIENLICQNPHLAPHYFCEISRDGRLDDLTVVVEASADAEGKEMRDAAALALQKHIKSMIGVTARVDVRNPGGVPRSEGKAKRVVDLRREVAGT